MQTLARDYSDESSPRESRAGFILRDYWDGLRLNRPYPTENEIDPDDIDSIWDSCFLISIDDVTRRMGYRYSYLGKKLIEAYGDDDGNPDIVTQLLSTRSQRIKDNFDEVLHSQKPLVDEAEFVNLKHMNIKYRISLFPLGDSTGVTHIIGCMRWRMY
jgi:hypothetical protein